MNKMLRQFMAVAEAGTMSGGATAALVSQPSLTVNMRRLEETMGVPLFIRTPRGVRLTEYGETLYQNARLMQRLYDNTLKALERQRQRTEEGLRIGSGYSWWSLFIRDMVVDHSKRHPGARIYVSLGNQLRCMDLLLGGDISMFVAHEIEGLSHNTGTELIPLMQVGAGYFVRAGHPLLGRPCTMADIDRFPMVSTAVPEARHQRFFETWTQTLADSAFDQQHYTFASNSLAACLDYVEHTDAVINHTDVMAREFERRGLHRLSLTDPARKRTVGIYVLRERMGEQRTMETITLLKQAAATVLPL
ncbi:MAG: LysR family transcriptional regulator [Aquamicrobium sp.]|jgi:LysR family transcriptional regulator of abg operon|uniref:LysR family transcriptional regulator n=1 Tax=Mesorhizobium TaxID=68287 RepID=UPI0010108FF6|nr:MULTISPECIES: LysR family transcriptional regulator [Mesorhizobium]MBR2688880.1 LysR family transcriptional regulator [Aquamicrobium sp.]QAZ42877.1 LysR family transcriptional regulator [Mesorhizobium sp. Pch-S]